MTCNMTTLLGLLMENVIFSTPKPLTSSIAYVFICSICWLKWSLFKIVKACLKREILHLILSYHPTPIATLSWGIRYTFSTRIKYVWLKQMFYFCPSSRACSLLGTTCSPEVVVFGNLVCCHFGLRLACQAAESHRLLSTWLHSK